MTLRRRHPNLKVIALLGAIWFEPLANAVDKVDVSKAAGVKAAYLKHIAALTTWPPARSNTNRPIIIGIIGKDPNGVFVPIRDRIRHSPKFKAQGRRFELNELGAHGDSLGKEDLLERLRLCDVLFLTKGGASYWQRIKPLVDTLPIVTVGEVPKFAEQGGMIEYFIDLRSGNIRMIINIDAVSSAGLTLSSRLLGLESVILLGVKGRSK